MCIAMHNHIYQTTPIKLQKNYPFQNTVIGVDNQSSECDKIVSAKMKLVEQWNILLRMADLLIMVGYLIMYAYNV